ncbi:Mll1809 protein [Microbacterium sp. HM58-2]|nr:Mll1809 protein [Microbacterium sp. HM58-2]
MKMHAGELDIDHATASRLIGAQHPEWRHEEIRRVASEGTVNAIFRIGDDLAARLPLTDADPDELRAALEREAAAMHELVGVCPVPTPAPVAIGEPGPGYPLPWSVQTWVPGDVATPDGLAHSATFARDLVELIVALRGADTRGRAFDGGGRGGDLRDSDAWMETCFRESAALLPVDDLRALWARFRMLPAPGPDVMAHGDLTPGNLLVSGERLAGVLDGGGFAPADPSLDLVSAWHLLDAEARAVVREGLTSGETEWLRGAAWAFQQAMGLVWYYRVSNPGMSALGRSTLHRILTDPEVGNPRNAPVTPAS